MDIINLNRASIVNLSDSELTRFCTFDKAVHDMDGAEFLINELARRMEATSHMEQELTQLQLDNDTLQEEIYDLQNERTALKSTIDHLNEDVAQSKRILFTRDAVEAASCVKKREAQVAFYLPKMSIEEMMRVSDLGQKLPQKSTCCRGNSCKDSAEFCIRCGVVPKRAPKAGCGLACAR